jgi:hypothetical protein
MTELAQRIAAGGFTTLSPEVQTALTQAAQRVWVNRQAERSVDAYEAALARGERKKLTARQFAQEPRPTPVLRNELVIGPNGLAGPSEAGKSLFVRDWLLEIAESGRKVLAVLSEGTHDFEARWSSHPRYERAADNIYVLDEPVDLVHGATWTGCSRSTRTWTARWPSTSSTTWAWRTTTGSRTSCRSLRR